MTIGAFLSMARAMEMRCFSPPERVEPPSPITVSYTHLDVYKRQVLRCAETFLNGNTDYDTPLREALRLMEQEGFENADMVFVTDGECVLPDSFLEKLKAEQSARGFQITGSLLDQEDAGFEFSLREFCTNVYRTSQLSRDQIAEQLVVSRVA